MNTRPKKLTEEFIKRFAEEVEDGLSFEYTSYLLECHPQNSTNWMRQGEADVLADRESIYAEFFSTVKKSYARFIRTCKKKITKGEDGWQGTAWWLERTNRNFMKGDDNTQSETIIVNPNVTKNKE